MKNSSRCYAKYLILFLFLVLCFFPVYGQSADQSAKRYDLFISPLAEVIGYSKKGPAYGGGLALGAGEGGITLGIKMLYAADNESMNSFEFTFFARYYIFSQDESTGLFAQINAGPVIIGSEDAFAMLTEVDSVSLGLSVGWRFAFGKHFFLEPTIRGGYPYIAGAGLSVGYRF